MLKITLIVLLVLMVISLFAGLGFLFKDSDKTGSKRAFYALGTRVGLAISLLVLTSYGLYTGQLGVSAPWHSSNNAPSENIDKEK